MHRTGTVRRLDGEFAKVVIKRQTACGENCANCGGCLEKYNEITAKNSIGATVGDTVVIEMEDKTVLSAAFWVYIFPLIIFFAGYGVFYMLKVSEILSVVLSVLLSGLFYIFLYFKDKKDSVKYLHKITEIINVERN